MSVFSLYLQLWDEKWKLHQLWIDLTNCPLQNLHKRNGGKYSFIRLLLLYSLFTFSATRSTFTKVWNHQKCLISIFMPKIQTLKYLMMAWKLLLIWKWMLQNETFLIDFQTVWVYSYWQDLLSRTTANIAALIFIIPLAATLRVMDTSALTSISPATSNLWKSKPTLQNLFRNQLWSTFLKQYTIWVTEKYAKVK